MYGSEMLVLSASIAKRIEGMHTEFLRMIMGKKSKQLGYGTWDTPGTEVIDEKLVTQLDRIYIEQRQETVAQWVALHPLFEVCARETGYEGGGRRRKVWWCQEARENNFVPLCKIYGKLKGGGGEVGRWAYSRTAIGR